MEYVTNFFSIASWMTILVLVASLSAIAAAVIEITKKKKIFRNIAWVAFGLYGIKIGLGLYATDLNAGFFTKHLLSAIEKDLGVTLSKLEVKQSDSGYKVKIYGNELPSKQSCEARLISIREWGSLTGQFSITSISNPASCTDGKDLAVQEKSHNNNPAQQSKNTQAAQSESAIPAIEQGVTISTFSSKSKIYTLRLLKPEQASHVFMLMSSQPATTTTHPINENNNFQNSEITTEPGTSALYPKTTLKINGAPVITASIENDDYSLEHLASLKGEEDLLLINTYGGGNACHTSMQMIVADAGNGKYNFSKQFGRCSPSWWREENTIYFVYAADEYNSLEIISLSGVPK